MNEINMNNILGQIDFIKNRLAELQEELAEITVEGEDPQGIVTTIVSGTGDLLDFKLNFELFSTINQDELKAALVQASNNGLKAAREIAAEKKRGIIGGVNIPDIPGLF